MAMIATSSEAAVARLCGHLKSFQICLSTYGASWLKFLAKFFVPEGSCLVPPSTDRPPANEKRHTTEVDFEESGKKKEGIGHQYQKPLTSNGKYGYERGIRSDFHSSWLLTLAVVFVLLNHAMAHDADCSIWKGKRNDTTLDVLDVKASLSSRGIFTASDQNYNKICADAFKYSPVEEIILNRNNISDLPANLFSEVGTLSEAGLADNSFTNFPPALNSSKTLRFVTLAGNDIDKVGKYTINGMSGLRVLDISRNKISAVPEDIFDMPHLWRVNLSQTRLRQLPLPPSTPIVTFNVMLVIETYGNVLSISFPGSGKRNLVINITAIETLNCTDARDAVERSYDILEGKIVCDHGSFKTINILLRGKGALEESANDIKDAMGANMASADPPGTAVPNREAASSSADSYQDGVPFPLVVIMVVIGAILGGVVALVVKQCASRRSEASCPV